MNDQTTNPQTPAKPRRGCFFYGCITSLVLLLILVIAGLVAVHYAKKAVHGLVNDYTDTQPVSLPTVQMSQADIDKLNQRVDAFRQAVKDQRPTPPLELTADDINALISSGKDNHFKGKLYVSLDGDKIKGELSLPLEEVGLRWQMFKGRYLNGTATFSVSLRDGVLFVSPQNILVKGKPIPDMYMQGIRNQNFATGMTNDPNAQAVIDHLQSIEVKDGKLMVVPKEKQ